jgi:VanZ family protein
MIFIKKYYLAILWALISLTACGVNGNSLPKINLDISIDKIAHILLFGVQAWLILRENQKRGSGLNWKQAHIAVVVSIVYGIVIEGLQATVFINRSYDYADMVADGIGAVMCYPLAMFWFRLK